MADRVAPVPVPVLSRTRFVGKIGAAVALVALADILFFDQELGWTLGLFAAAWVALGALVLRSTVAPRARQVALLAAALFAAVLVDDPNPLAWCLFWLANASAALLGRVSFDDAARWMVRLGAHGLYGLSSPFWDARRLARSRAGRGGGIVALASLVALPLVGGTIFTLLFANANPVIAAVFATIEIPGLGRALLHLLLWAFVLVLVWPTLRPRTFALVARIVGADPVRLPELPRATLTLSLLTFNAIFLVQNLLDIVFLWRGAALPAGVTMAEYAHRGAYALIATALLAGLFVLVALRPGGAGARSPMVRRLVVLWVAQNLLLVASSVLRTLDYIAAYSLTELRIAALAWMALVACGLVLICWRMLAGRTATWLINANAAAAAAVLAAASVVDLGAAAATWNVDHARRAERLDLCYLDRLGASALLPVIALERRAAGPRLRDQARYLRIGKLARLTREQADWHSWSWRGARRLAAARAAVATMPATLRPAPHGRGCGGTAATPPIVAAPRASATLTKGGER
jgi:hypothetical protein